MTADYLALIDPHGLDPALVTRAATLARRHGMTERFRGDDLLLFASMPTTPLGDSGVLAGRVCGIDGHGLAALGAVTRQSGGRALMTRCWGDYIGFSRDTATPVVMAMRSPPGGMPAYRATLEAATLVSSSVELLIALGIAPTIDWSFVAQHLGFPHLRGRRTGLAGIDEIIAGECLMVGRDRTRRIALWTPWRLVGPERSVLDREHAADIVRDAVLSSVAALAAPSDTLLLELSGGLDSSVLAAALQAAGVRAIAVNLTTPGPEGDERPYARAVANRTGHRLIECAVADALDLTDAVWSRTARPGIPAMLRGADRQFLEVGRREGVDAYVSGSGGDCVFSTPQSATPAADAWRRFGLGRQFVRTAADVAEIHGASVWRALRLGWRQARRAPVRWERADAFLNLDAVPSEPVPHPWLDEPDEVLPGKRAHVRAILATLGHLDGYARQSIAPSLYPLLSQPVLEACLRVPSWLWVDGGRDRAIARLAFRDLLPAAVIDRRTKGTMDGYCVATFDRNRERLRDFLGRGHLAAHGLLDIDQVRSYLAQPPIRRDQRFYDLLPIIDCEAWLRGWLGAPD